MRVPRAAAAAAALFLLSSLARGDVTVTSSLGFDGGWVPGSVTPVRLELSSSEKSPVTVTLRVLPSRGGVVAGGGLVSETTVFLAPGARKRLTIPVLTGAYSFDGEWRLSIETDRRLLLRHGTNYREGRSLQDTLEAAPGGAGMNSVALESSYLTVAVLGAPSGGLLWMQEVPESAAPEFVTKRQWGGTILLAPDSAGAVVLPAFTSVDLPTAPDPWICYEGFDALLWIDPDPELLEDAAQLDAVLEYAAHGGRLLVALTPGARIPAGSPLARALPALASGHGDVTATAVVAALAGGSPRGRTPPVPVPLARLEAVRGRVLHALPDGRPLVVAGDHGLGSVVVLAFDPRALAGSEVGDRAALLLALFGGAAGPAPTEEGYESTGVGSVIGHLRKRFMTPPPLGLLILGLAVYVLAIGPVDYFLLKRKKRLRRTVFTFPAIVLVFTLLAWGSSFLLFGGEAGRARVAFLDFATSPDRDADVYRGLDFLGSYSPTGSTLEASWDAPRSFVGFPWLGSGTTSWGNQGEAGGLEGLVRLGPDGRPSAVVDVPLRSHRTLQARFSGEVPTALDAVVREGESRPVLEVTNGLPLQVHELQVVWSGHVVSLGELAPGDRVTVPLAIEAGPWRTLRSRSTLPASRGGGGFFGGEDSFVPRDGTPASLQVARRDMARAAAGATFGTLFSGGETGARMARVLARQGLDLSRQAAEGRPVLVGWCDGDPLGVLPDGGEVGSTVVVVRRVAATVREGKR